MSTEGIKVYVDDLRACPVGWTLARTITEAIRLLAQFNVAEISIDHDIMHAVKPLKMIPLPASVKIVDEEKFLRYCDQGIEVPIACAETYEPVVWFIAAMPERLRPVVRFHTANPAGREKMEAVLKNFSWPDEAAAPLTGREVKIKGVLDRIWLEEKAGSPGPGYTSQSMKMAEEGLAILSQATETA